MIDTGVNSMDSIFSLNDNNFTNTSFLPHELFDLKLGLQTPKMPLLKAVVFRRVRNSCLAQAKLVLGPVLTVYHTRNSRNQLPNFSHLFQTNVHHIARILPPRVEQCLLCR